MKKLLLTAIILGLCTVAHAGHSVNGFKLDTPNIVKFSDNLYLGSEIGKDVVNDLFRDDSSYLEADKGYFGYIKLTYTGSLFDLSK